MLYKKNSDFELSRELFKNPTSEYRGFPFWAWNCRLDKKELLRQLDVFREMGFGGFHMHVRTGLETPYLSDEFMDAAAACVGKAKEEGMLTWLYDEDRWPSGSAGGLVTKDAEYRERYLLFTSRPYRDGEGCDTPVYSRCEGGRNGKGTLLAVYDVTLDEDGFLAAYKRLDPNKRETENSGSDRWYAYLEVCSPSKWYNNQTYVDTLNKNAVRRFTEITHERYKQFLRDDFGGAVPAIFTDEPQFVKKGTLNGSFDKTDVNLPWTESTVRSYENRFGENILDFLPELFWDLPDNRISAHRYRYHECIAEDFASSFSDTCGDWCRKNGIYLTGHMMEEPTLKSQTSALGEAMRSYRSFDFPGIDMLCGNIELTTAKQAQSAARQFGREGVLSELYGVTGWDYDFRGYKFQGDWQAALGVTVRVPHLSWASMAGEAKRDYPPSIGYQSPWYREFSYVEDHFARVNTAMTRGKPVVNVAVIHPIDSYWIHWGPNDKSGFAGSVMDEKFKNITEWLLKGCIDFDFISESLLPSLCKSGGNPLRVGKAEYSAVVVPDCETLRTETFDRLFEFADRGGTLIIMGNPPKYENAENSVRGAELARKARVVPYDRYSILTELNDFRDVTVRYGNGSLADKFVYRLRRDNSCRWFFMSHCVKPNNKDIFSFDNLKIEFKGRQKITIYDTLNGETYPAQVSYENGNTIVKTKLYDYDSLLLEIREIGDDNRSENEYRPVNSADFCQQVLEREKTVHIPDAVDFTLDEPNVLLLDMCEFKVDGGEYFDTEEILRADNIAREIAGLPIRGGEIVQPWVLPAEKPAHSITLKFTINSEITVQNPLFALECAEQAEINLNGESVKNTVCGWYTDKSIKTIRLPCISKGRNILTVSLPLGLRTNTEWCYLLGNFGVRVAGKNKTVTELPKKLAFDNTVSQGLPFYGGNITYHLKAECRSETLRITVPRYRGAVIKVFADGKEKGYIAYSPNTLKISGLAKGVHQIDLKLFTNRFNAFGAVHNADDECMWHGPNVWRTKDERWTYNYNLKPVGILSEPLISDRD
ncbi:MAG: hypothetical protein LUH40_03385 [Clostridiales bacterium]|nr:hypothetical protein [Clostridiales bacterium]